MRPSGPETCTGNGRTEPRLFFEPQLRARVVFSPVTSALTEWNALPIVLFSNVFPCFMAFTQLIQPGWKQALSITCSLSAYGHNPAVGMREPVRWGARFLHRIVSFDLLSNLGLPLPGLTAILAAQAMNMAMLGSSWISGSVARGGATIISIDFYTFQLCVSSLSCRFWTDIPADQLVCNMTQTCASLGAVTCSSPPWLLTSNYAFNVQLNLPQLLPCWRCSCPWPAPHSPSGR